MSTPNYYQFPNGTQPLELSRYLTSNGGQALQYVARSCRLDDESNKHDDAADDLVKAVHFLCDEIKRVGTDEDLERVREILGEKKEGPKIPVYFEGGQSVEYRMCESPRVCLGTAYATGDPISEEIWQDTRGPVPPKMQAYLTFEPK